MVAALLGACPSEPPTHSVDMGSDVPTVDASRDVAADAGPRQEYALRFVAEPVDVGLFTGAPPFESLEIQFPDTARAVEFEWPEGVWEFALVADAEQPRDAGEQLVGLSSERFEAGRERRVFVPAPTTVRVVVTETDGSLGCRIERLGEAPRVPVDSPAHARSVGPWFDRVEELNDSEDPGAVVVELMDDLRSRGGPIETDHGFLFIAPAQDGEPPPQIRGTWNDWGADPASELVRIAPGFWARYVEVPDGRHEYKLFYPNNESWVVDAANRHVAWDGIDTGTVGQFNSVLRPASGDSRLTWLGAVYSPELENSRNVYVQLPPGYDSTDERFPTLVVHDGNESIARGRFHHVARDLAQADAETATILVYVALPSQDLRLAEYTMATDESRGDEYVTFLADTLMPQVDELFRTLSGPNARGVAGASLGGLISYWATMQHSDVFGYAAGMSSSFFWEDEYIVGELEARGCQDSTYYLDSGSPADNFEVTQTMRDTLDQLGCDYRYELEEGGEHEWSYWHERFDMVLEHFADVHGE
jgi:enterochelin esterase family protein